VNRLAIQNKKNNTYKIESREIFLELLWIWVAIIIVKLSNTACDNIRRECDREINAMPDIRTAMTLNSNNVCLICSFFQIVLYVNERIAIVLKYPTKTMVNILKM
jgi:hypothetical protein